MPLPEPFTRRFVVLSGKGGVGKSTLAAAIALRNAEEGRRTCIVQLNTRDAIGPLFPGVGEVGYEPTRLDPALPLWACNLRPGPALREYGVMKLRFRALHRVVFENDVMRRLLAMIPGMTETFLLGKAWFMEAMDQDESGRPSWDTLVLDAPSTGHGITLLQLPEVLLSVVPVGPMAEDARRMSALLADPSRTALHVATLPAELPVNEALDLERLARERVGIPSGTMLCNQLLPDLLADVADDALTTLAATPDVALAAAGRNARAFADWRAQQQLQLGRLAASTRMPLLRLPHLLGDVERAGLVRLGDAIVAGGTA
ncbi:MAG: hypothetical protein RIT45_597 [Pseudomonadota bacterium]